MSSIYRKGRDGYYYYQTYLFNSKTGKVDKKIYHSLKTRDQVEAEKKQIIFDKKYKQKIKKPLIRLRVYKRTVFIILLSLSTMIMIFFVYDPTIKNKLPDKLYIPIQKDQKIIKKSLSVKVDSINIKPSKKIQETNTKYLALTNSEKPLPKYVVQKVDLISGPFKQGKIYITVDEGCENSSLIIICQNIRDKYKEFSNVIICIYSNTTQGILLSKGQSDINNRTQQKVWLAMYSYNSVEGEYFDSNPSGYLGNY